MFEDHVTLKDVRRLMTQPNATTCNQSSRNNAIRHSISWRWLSLSHIPLLAIADTRMLETRMHRAISAALGRRRLYATSSQRSAALLTVTIVVGDVVE